MIPFNFAKITGGDMAFLLGVLVGLFIAGLIGWAVVLFAARMMIGG